MFGSLALSCDVRLLTVVLSACGRTKFMGTRICSPTSQPLSSCALCTSRQGTGFTSTSTRARGVWSGFTMKPYVLQRVGCSWWFLRPTFVAAVEHLDAPVRILLLPLPHGLYQADGYDIMLNLVICVSHVVTRECSIRPAAGVTVFDFRPCYVQRSSHLCTSLYAIQVGAREMAACKPDTLRDHTMRCVWLLSAVFHTFNCMSEEWTVRLYKLDLVGILGLILGSFANGLYYGFYCTPHVGRTLCAAVCVCGRRGFTGVATVLRSYLPGSLGCVDRDVRLLCFGFVVPAQHVHTLPSVLLDRCASVCCSGVVEVACTWLTAPSAILVSATVVFGLTPSVHWGLVASREAFSLFVYYLSGMYAWSL